MHHAPVVPAARPATQGAPRVDERPFRRLDHLERVAAERYGDEGFYIDGERRRIPDHWHAHARPAGGFFDPRSALYPLEGEPE